MTKIIVLGGFGSDSGILILILGDELAWGKLTPNDTGWVCLHQEPSYN